MPEEQQEQGGHEPAYLYEVIGMVMVFCGLDPLHSQTQIRFLKVGRHFAQYNQDILPYLFPVGEMAESILRNLDEKIASPLVSMKAEKLSKLLPPLAAWSRKYYRFEVSLASQLLLLSLFITELSFMRSHKNISKSDITFTLPDVEEVEAASRMLPEAAPWINW